ncbi:MAG: glutathione S-transferase [Lautropia sp.]|nr:glutathione S-transferase [Lautropia sp.]
MKLWYSTTSPYVRKVRATAAHHGLNGQIELQKVTTAFSADSPHNRSTPIGRIPILQTDDGTWLFNSNVIAEYLDSIGKGSTLYPKGQERWKVLNLHALAEGMLENTVVMLAEKLTRPQAEWWTKRHTQIQQRNLDTLPMLAEHLKPFGTELNIGTLFAACAIDFMLFRDNLIDARQTIADQGLERWAEDMNTLYPCLASTKPYVSG